MSTIEIVCWIASFLGCLWIGWLFVTGRVVYVNRTNKSLRCVVMDIETLSTAVNAKIISVGLVVGDLSTGEIENKIQFNIKEDCQPGRITDEATLKFWEDIRTSQSSAAWYENTVNKGQWISVEAFLDAIDRFMEPYGKLPIFGNGPEFDNAVMANLYESVGRKTPWAYGNNQSVRTMVLLGRRLFDFDPKYDKELSKGLVKHVALDDAILEFKYCSLIYRKIVRALWVW